MTAVADILASRTSIASGAGWLLRQLAAERDRWALWLPVGIGTGVAAYFALPLEPPRAAGAGALALALALAALCRRHAVLPLALAAVALAAGFAAAQLRTQLVAAPVLAKKIERATVTGRIAEIVPRDRTAWLVLDRVAIDRLAPAATPERVRLSLGSSAAALLEPGQILRLRATLEPPSTPAAPGAYDFQRAAWFAGIGAVGFAVSRPQVVEASESASWRTHVEVLRRQVFRRVTAALPGETGAVAAALMMGERGAMSPALLQAMRDSGLAHLLSISGLHIGLVAGVVFFALRAGFAAVPALALRYPIKKWAAAVAAVAALGYLILSGSAVPAERAFLMTAIVLLGVLADRIALSMRLIAWAAVAILLVQPESLLGASFQLSFAAVGALIAVYEGAGAGLARRLRELSGPTRILAFLATTLLTTLVAGLATGLIGLFHFNRIAAYGLAANAIAVPVTSLWVMPWAVAAFLLMPLGLEGLALAPMGWGVAVIDETALAVAAWPGAAHLLAAFAYEALPLVALGGAWLCLWRRPWRLLGVPAIAAGVAFGAVGEERPDILVAADGGLIAVRAPDGRLLMSSGRGNSLERAVWLERDGATAAGAFPPPGAGPEGPLACDRLGCVYRRDGLSIALVREVAALAEECRRADVVVATVPVRGACPRPRLVIDRFDLLRDGSQALRVSDGAVAVTTALDRRGSRPWSGKPTQR